MICPKCETEAAVMAVRQEEREGKTFRVLLFQCRNKRCELAGKVVGERRFLSK